MLKTFIHFNLRPLVLMIGLFFAFFINAQNSSVTNRTPEQEAKKQTEKMQKELTLSDEQTEKVYKVNLKYAKERKEANSRIDAMKRIRKKDEEFKKILTSEQYRNLKSKRSNVNSVEIEGRRRYSGSSNEKSSRVSKTHSVRSTVRYGGTRPVRTNRSVGGVSSQRDVNRSVRSTYNARPVRSTQSDTKRSHSTPEREEAESSEVKKTHSSETSTEDKSKKTSSKENNTSQQTSPEKK